VVGWVRVGDPGVTVRHITGLLALDATASGSLRLVDAEVSHQRVLSTDLPSYAAGFRPTFLVLQSAFIAGLMARSLREAEAALDRGENAVFAGDVTDLGREVDAWMTRWRTAAADTSAAPLRELLELRLAAAALASRATRIEATLAGGRGYVTTSGASRRFREAAFLPVQSPSEGHLRWELSSLA
jgi:alkylation response protein AidB-like acyl-CoA dehydrogenase